MRKYIAPTILSIVILIFFNACDKVQPPYMNKITIDSSSTKRVLCEEGTATWCTNCTKGICSLEKMIDQYPDNFIPIAIHFEDPMSVDGYVADFTSFADIQGIPCSVIDRNLPKNETDYEDILTAYSTAINTIPPVDMKIMNISWNSSNRVLTYTVSAEVIAEFNGDYRFNSVLTEDSVHGTTSDWDQANSYGGGVLEMCGFENLATTIPAADMYYNHVARHIFDGWDGISGSIPATNTIGTTLTKTYTYTLPVGWNADKVNAIGFIINKTDGTVVNACQAVHVGK
ncbi:MAG TPA: Omp28-related outer membrane protein [Bacteroidales bacterium]|nr:Omp28-related outer membrane protein [Bacteroidales bacterium]HPS18458.1 Omp28-related outer membrane protein [Bacteroidales bacterium]